MFATILHIDLDAFFVSVEQVHDPTLKNKPVIVGGRPGGRGVVASASYEARKFGVRSAMPIVKAQQLCPDAIFLEGSFSRYREASGRFFEILSDFSPVIEPGGLDEAYVDITGTEFIYGPPRQLAKRLKYRVRTELGLPSSVGIANSKIVAKVASELSKPDGLVEVFPGAERDFLAPLPVGDLPGAGKKTEQALKGIGIVTIGQLASTPVEQLRKLFGTWGSLLSDHANGIDGRKVELRGEARSMSRESTFGSDTLDRPFLESVLWKQSERLGAELRSSERMARCVTLKLRYADFETLSRSVTLATATDSDRTIFDNASQLLNKTLNWTGQPVRLIGVEVSRLTSSRQLSLIDGDDNRRRLDRVLDRIRNRYGFGSIQSGRAFPAKDTED